MPKKKFAISCVFFRDLFEFRRHWNRNMIKETQNQNNKLVQLTFELSLIRTNKNEWVTRARASFVFSFFSRSNSDIFIRFQNVNSIFHFHLRFFPPENHRTNSVSFSLNVKTNETTRRKTKSELKIHWIFFRSHFFQFGKCSRSVTRAAEITHN